MVILSFPSSSGITSESYGAEPVGRYMRDRDPLRRNLLAPQTTLREIHRILKPNGVLLFQTGDADSFLARLNPHTWTYLDPPVHLNVFSRKALQDLAEKIGFKPLYSWSFDRAPQKLPILGGRRSSTAFRPFLDLAARQGLIGATFVWRKG